MEKRKRRKHQSHKRALVIVNEHRPYLESTPGGAIAVGNLDHAVADEAAAFVDQENGQSEQRAAAGRAEKSRRALQVRVKHFGTVSAIVAPAGGDAAPFDPSRPPNDEHLIGRVEAIHAAASADADAFVKGGVPPSGLDALSAELAAFKKAKDTLTLASRQHSEATARFDRALEQGDTAIAVVEGILAISPDAPAGALAALHGARRIGPRVGDAGQAAGSPSTPPPAAAPAPDKAA